MKKVVKGLLYLSMGMALVLSGCKDDDNDPSIDALVGSYTGTLSVEITSLPSIDETVTFKLEKVSNTEFNLTALEVSTLAGYINISLNANSLSLTETSVAGISATSGTFMIPQQNITIENLGTLTIKGTAVYSGKDGVVASTAVSGVAVTSIELEAEGTMVLTANPTTPIPAEISISIIKM